MAVTAVSKATADPADAMPEGSVVPADSAIPADPMAPPRRNWRGVVHAVTERAVTAATLGRYVPRQVAALPRRTLRAIIVVGLALSVLIIGFWIYHVSQHVTSRNAVVRGQLTEIGTRLSGVLATIEVREGERVKSGQVLARLDDRHLRSEVLEAQAHIEGLEREAELERSTVKQERSKRGNRLQESVAKTAAARAEVAAAQSRANEAREYHKARLMLFKDQIVSLEAVRDAAAKYHTATALLDVARANGEAAKSAERNTQLESIDMDLREERIDVLLANVRAAKARLERAQADVEGALIRAPGDGAVIRWLIKPGGAVEGGKSVVSMAIGNDAWIEAWIDEDDIRRVKVGSEATVTLPSYPGHEFKGVVETIGLTTDLEQPTANMPQPRYMRMRGTPVIGVLVRLQDAPAALLPGLSVAVAIRGESR